MTDRPESRFDDRAQLRFGWWCLLLFVTAGVALEALHGFKLPFYLDLANSTRRMLWRLGHAHGTLLSLLNIAFALTAAHLGGDATRWTTPARLLRAATVLMPAGFMLGGIWIHGGDPGLGVVLVGLGGLILCGAVFSTARAVGRR